MSQPLPPHPPNLFQSPFKITISSNSQLKRLSIKRSCPSNIEFNLEDASELKNRTFKDLLGFFSKRVMKLKNPPLKETLKNVRLANHLRRLEVKPLDVAKYVTRITRRFSKLTHLAIRDESDIFLPIRVKGKVYPMRSLKSFVYNHEFCKEFIKCARYVNSLKIRKICVDFSQLRRFQRLENIYIILK